LTPGIKYTDMLHWSQIHSICNFMWSRNFTD